MCRETQIKFNKIVIESIALSELEAWILSS